MFSGLITTTGRFSRRNGRQIRIEMKGPTPKLGDSLAINGVCLTVVKVETRSSVHSVSFDLSQETLRKTTLQKLRRGAIVNLEPALKVTDALGGHMVQGHVDGIGRVRKVGTGQKMKNLTFEAPVDIMAAVVEKGSVTVDGVSLTAINVGRNEFSVALIPYTLQHTNLKTLKKGDVVNLEADIIGKYVLKFIKKL